MFLNKTEILWTAGNTVNKWSSKGVCTQNPYRDRLWDRRNCNFRQQRCHNVPLALTICILPLFCVLLTDLYPTLGNFRRFPKGIVFPALVFLPLTFLSACCCLSPSVLGSVGLQAHAQISYTVRGTAGRCCDAEISLEGAARVHSVSRLQLAMDKH